MYGLHRGKKDRLLEGPSCPLSRSALLSIGLSELVMEDW